MSSSVKLNSLNRAKTYNKDSLSDSASNVESDLIQRIVNLENEIEALKVQQDEQIVQNCSVYDEFLKLKGDFEKASTVLELLSKGDQSPCSDLMRSRVSAKLETQSGTSNALSGDDAELKSFSGAQTIEWLKGKVFEMSENMRLQDECLRQIKLYDLCRLKKKSDCLAKVLQSVKCQLVERKADEPQAQVEEIKADIVQFHCQIQEIENKLESAKLDARRQLNLLRLEMQENLGKRLRTASSTSRDSAGPIRIQSLEKSDDESNSMCPLKRTTQMHSCKFVGRVNCGSESSSYDPIPQKVSSESLQVHPESRGSSCSDSPRRVGATYSQSQDLQDEGACNNEWNIILKQISSQNLCLQQVIRDMGLKINRKEFESCRRQLCELCDQVMKMRMSQQFPPTAAGAAIPLMRNVNCISCHATTNMRITTETIPVAPALNYGRICGELKNECLPGCQPTRKSSGIKRTSRRAGGSRTTLSKAMQVRAMRFKRLNTPVKVCSSVMVYKSRFRRAQMNRCE